jgi:hypothetical protein
MLDFKKRKKKRKRKEGQKSHTKTIISFAIKKGKKKINTKRERI